jgi:hypothetical protein
MTNTRSAKLHISLPADLFAFVTRRQQERHESLSAVVADAIRREMVAERQARLDEALALDAEENVAFARASAAVASRVIARDRE